jgi:hypothetical protein
MSAPINPKFKLNSLSEGSIDYPCSKSRIYMCNIINTYITSHQACATAQTGHRLRYKCSSYRIIGRRSHLDLTWIVVWGKRQFPPRGLSRNIPHRAVLSRIPFPPNAVVRDLVLISTVTDSDSPKPSRQTREVPVQRAAGSQPFAHCWRETRGTQNVISL